MGLNGRRADIAKQTLLDFSFSLSKKQKVVAAEEQEHEKEVSSVKDDGWEAEDVSVMICYLFAFRVDVVSVNYQL